jgi:ElaB/YqjD/DUF883 family membrane-anchored ribosome-binding protein
MGELASDTVVQLRDFRGRGFARLTDQARGAARAADDFIRANPWQAVGVVAVVGLGVGLLAARLASRTDGKTQP